MFEVLSAVRRMLTAYLDANIQWLAGIAGPNWRSLNAKLMSAEEIDKWIDAYGHFFDGEIYSDLEMTRCKADDYVTFFCDIQEVEDLFLRVADFRQGLIDFSQFLSDIDLDSRLGH